MNKSLILSGLAILSEVIAFYTVNGTIGGRPDADKGDGTFTIFAAIAGIVLAIGALILSIKVKNIKHVVASAMLIILCSIAAFYAYFIINFDLAF